MKVATDSCLFGAWAAAQLAAIETGMETGLDIGTGTGLLSLMLAQKNGLIINAVEIDAQAAGQARENAEDSPWKNRLTVNQGDIMDFDPGRKYDCIISNPPFYENELASPDSRKNSAHHSRDLTMAQLIQVIRSRLEDKGIFFLLYPFKRKNEVEALLAENALSACKTVIVRQSVLHAPFRVMCMGTNSLVSLPELTTLSIWNEQQQYTPAFKDLLKDYYLYL